MIVHDKLRGANAPPHPTHKNLKTVVRCKFAPYMHRTRHESTLCTHKSNAIASDFLSWSLVMDAKVGKPSPTSATLGSPTRLEAQTFYTSCIHFGGVRCATVTMLSKIKIIIVVGSLKKNLFANFDHGSKLRMTTHNVYFLQFGK
jgi:hypothetical protein